MNLHMPASCSGPAFVPARTCLPAAAEVEMVILPDVDTFTPWTRPEVRTKETLPLLACGTPRLGYLVRRSSLFEGGGDDPLTETDRAFLVALVAEMHERLSQREP